MHNRILMSKRQKINLLTCSFCSKTQREVRKLIAGPQVYICNECVVLCDGIINEESKPAKIDQIFLPTPHEIKGFLDSYVIGQEEAKKVLSVAVYNHYKRVNHQEDSQAVELQKSNILLMGPTGTGKTLLAQSLARLLKVPFCVADATTLTEAGYVGEDVENILLHLISAANGDVAKAQKGIVYVDEVDKIARRSEGRSAVRDVSGEGVQQALLKLIEGSKITLSSKGAKKFGQADSGMQVDTRNILFICGGAFVGLDAIIKTRIGRQQIGFESKSHPAKESMLAEVSTEDMILFGLIPEFIGRLPVVSTLLDVTEDDLLQILQKPKNALVKQYQKLFAMEQVQLKFTEGALRAVAKQAITRKSGARGLRAVLEHAMLDVMYQVPFLEGLSVCTITEDVILEGAEPTLEFGSTGLELQATG